MQHFIRKTPVIFMMLILAAAGWKILLLTMDVLPFNSDEAIVALMARHILRGERPVFFYGQSYMGSLDAYLVSLGFAVFGQKVVVIRLVQTLLYLCTILTTALIARRYFGSNRVALLAVALLAIPPVNVTLYTTVSLGGYGEVLLIGNLLLLVGMTLIQESDCHKTRNHQAKTSGKEAVIGWGFLQGMAFLFGLLTGIGFWINTLTLVYAVPVGIAWLWTLRPKRSRQQAAEAAWMLFCAGIGFFAGSAPWWVHAIQTGWTERLMELLGSAAAVEQGSWIMRTLIHLVNFLVLGLTAVFGLRPPWEVRWLALPLLPLALAFWLAAIGFFIRQSIQQNQHRFAYRILLGIVLSVAAAFILTSFGRDPSGRYFLPLTVPLALAAAHLTHRYIQKTRWQNAIIGLVILFNGWGTLQCAARYPPGITTQFEPKTMVDHRYNRELMQFLLEQDEQVGYSSYWVSFPLAFLSEEQLIYAPGLPYHQNMRYNERDDRYPAYSAIAASAAYPAYISARDPALETHLRREFTRLGVDWTEASIGDYQVFYRLSQAVHPVDIGFGRTGP
jgi:4-amino-4-deoxy-L-arabinose transferase-like glycosyltransferase